MCLFTVLIYITSVFSSCANNYGWIRLPVSVDLYQLVTKLVTVELATCIII